MREGALTCSSEEGAWDEYIGQYKHTCTQRGHLHPSFPGQWSGGRPKISAFVRRLVGRPDRLSLPQHRGKACALNAAVAAAGGEILVFTDARQELSPDAVAALVENFADREVGAVGGELVLAGDAPAGAYWRYEAALRRWESASGSTIGVSGALYALRRQLWAPLPAETRTRSLPGDRLMTPCASQGGDQARAPASGPEPSGR